MAADDYAPPKPFKTWPVREFFVVADSSEADPEDDVWTISDRPDVEGWETDSGYSGYGLRREIAQFLCDAANEKMRREKF